MEVVAWQFVDRIKRATQDFESSPEEATLTITDDVQELFEDMRQMETEIDSSLNEISATVRNVADFSSEAHGFSDETLGQVYELDRKLEHLQDVSDKVELKIIVLLEKLGML